MAYQFMHIESYARKAAKGKQSARAVVDEAVRKPDSVPHVDEPEAPTQIQGPPLDAWWSEIEAEAEAATTAASNGPRRLRADRPLLTAGVASLPADLDERLDEWIDLNLTWLRDEFGDRLGPVLLHTDEAHPHLHFYVAPERREHEAGYELLPTHPGMVAEREAREAGQPSGKCKAAFTQSLKSLQDRYHEAVGEPTGLARLGPGRRRLSRKAWRAEQQQAAALAETLAKAEDEQGFTDLERDHVITKAKAEMRSILRTGLEEIRGYASVVEDRLEEKRQALDAREAELQQRENEIESDLDLLDDYIELYGPLPGAEPAPE